MRPSRSGIASSSSDVSGRRSATSCPRLDTPRSYPGTRQDGARLRQIPPSSPGPKVAMNPRYPAGGRAPDAASNRSRSSSVGAGE